MAGAHCEIAEKHGFGQESRVVEVREWGGPSLATVDPFDVMLESFLIGFDALDSWKGGSGSLKAFEISLWPEFVFGTLVMPVTVIVR